LIIVTTDLRPKLLPIRDQGRRNSCLSFATSAAHELFITSRQALSTEYLFYHSVAQNMAPVAHIGTSFSATATALKIEGQPDEAEWPYTAQEVLPWMPPNINGPIHKADLNCGKLSFDEVRDSLDQNRPVVLGLIITTSFFYPDSDGVVADIPADTPRGGHAVLAVGYGDIFSKQALLIRNSWGTGWGDAGHGWISEAYFNSHMRETGFVA